EAAEKATPGRIGDRIDGSGSIKYQCFGSDGSLVLQTDHKNMEYGFIGGNSEADELFFRLCDPSTVLALLDELEAKDKRIAVLEAREKSLRTVGVMSQKAFQRLEGRESRFIALWPRPEINLPRKRPEDGVIVYARVACTAKGE
ncbi:ead/Ea22-like family protein, partial [Enterobacter hormaechei]